MLRPRLERAIGDTVGRSFAHRFLAGTLAIGVLVLPASQAQAAKDRFAFIVGNSAYVRGANNEPLKNSVFNLVTPTNDAVAYAEALEGLGWEVINEGLVNKTRRKLLADLDEASKRVTQGSEVVFIFNGHGFSDDGTNFLVGVPETGERFSSVPDMETGSISLDDVVSKLSVGRPERIILIINACGDEPLVSDASRAPARPIFDDIDSEILVLYSSSPRGIAYDLLDNSEREVRSSGDDFGLVLSSEETEQPREVLSLFSRYMVPLLTEDRPLVSLFTEVRMAVEAQSRFSATDRGLPILEWRQIPHVLYDTIDGSFSLVSADVDEETTANASDWRDDGRLCRIENEFLEEALSLRQQGIADTSPQAQAVKDCILEAALSDLGISSLGFDAEGGSVIISQTNTVSEFRTNDRISMANVMLEGRRERFFFQSLDVFQDMLASTYFEPGSQFAFGWRRNDGTLPASGFARKDF
ncbi:MAG: caspase family protein [Pseudomonadota bacterium]